MAQAATRHQPSPLSPHPNGGRKYAPCTPRTPDSIYPSAMSPLASATLYFPDPNIEHTMSQTWQLSSTAMAYETQPIDPDILKMPNKVDNSPVNIQLQMSSSQPPGPDVLGGPVSFDSIMTPPMIEDQPQGLDMPGGPDCFDSIMTPPTIQDQVQSSVSPTSSNPRPSTWPSNANDTSPRVSTEHERARSEHGVGRTQPLSALGRPLSPHLEEAYPDGFVPWDPANPEKSDKIREKIPRNRAELLQQREDTAALRKAGGSCMACYRAKKKCGTTTPCPPCSSKGNRICFRSWGDLCLLGPPAGGSLTIFSFPSPEAKDTLQRMGDEVFKRMNAFNAVVNIRETYGGNCTAWHWTVTRSSIALSSTTDCPVDDFLTGLISALPLVDLVKFEDQYKHNPLVWTALRMANLFMAIQGLVQARIRSSWFDVTTGRLVSFYLLILSFRKLAEMSQDFCPGLYVALCGKDKQNSNKKNRPGKENEIEPAWVAAALYYRVTCGLQDLQYSPIVARIFGSFRLYLSGVREKLEDILRNVSPRHGATGKSSIRTILEDEVPSLPSSPSLDMAFWLGDLEEMSSVLGRPDGPFSPPACEMQAFLADHFPRPRFANPDEQHDGLLQLSATSHDTVIAQEQNSFDSVIYPDQVGSLDPNGLMDILNSEYDNGFDPMGAAFVDTMPPDTMPLYGNFQKSLYNC